MSYDVSQQLISNNRSGKALSAIGMEIHDTDTLGATAQNEHDYFNSAYRGSSAHDVIDWTKIIRLIPHNEVAWHAGPTANGRFIGVELCVPATHDATLFQAVWNRAVWFFANTFITELKIKTVTKDNLMSHAETSNKWGETDHQDPIAFFAEYGKTVEGFRTEVQAAINSITGGKDIYVSSGATTTTDSYILTAQKGLNRLKIADLVEDGITGAATIAATKIFQKLVGLTVDGVPGSNTVSDINTILAKPACGLPYKTPVPTKYIQWRLNIAIDGVFGNGTASSVKTYQQANGLTADGVVGNATWAKLIG